MTEKTVTVWDWLLRKHNTAPEPIGSFFDIEKNRLSLARIIKNLSDRNPSGLIISEYYDFLCTIYCACSLEFYEYLRQISISLNKNIFFVIGSMLGVEGFIHETLDNPELLQNDTIIILCCCGSDKIVVQYQGAYLSKNITIIGFSGNIHFYPK